ncbi:hypothetical protein BGZ58_007602 [Dissophora ornata]|nr:hypothetical protein BGZ58_007602 [Dissophora ornata]
MAAPSSAAAVEQSSQHMSYMDFPSSLEMSHRALADLTARPFMGTHQALEETSGYLQLTERSLADSMQNLARTRSNLEALVSRIKNAQEFLPSVTTMIEDDD